MQTKNEKAIQVFETNKPTAGFRLKKKQDFGIVEFQNITEIKAKRIYKEYSKFQDRSHEILKEIEDFRDNLEEDACNKTDTSKKQIKDYSKHLRLKARRLRLDSKSWLDRLKKPIDDEKKALTSLYKNIEESCKDMENEMADIEGFKPVVREKTDKQRLDLLLKALEKCKNFDFDSKENKEVFENIVFKIDALKIYATKNIDI